MLKSLRRGACFLHYVDRDALLLVVVGILCGERGCLCQTVQQEVDPRVTFPGRSRSVFGVVVAIGMVTRWRVKWRMRMSIDDEIWSS